MPIKEGIRLLLVLDETPMRIIVDMITNITMRLRIRIRTEVLQPEYSLITFPSKLIRYKSDPAFYVAKMVYKVKKADLSFALSINYTWQADVTPRSL